MSNTSVLSSQEIAPAGTLDSERTAVVANELFRLIEREYKKGNLSVTKDKYDALVKLRLETQLKRESSHSEKAPPALPLLFPPLFDKFTLPNVHKQRKSTGLTKSNQKFNFKSIESVFITSLETLANILDNLHLFAKMPLFPKLLLNLLKHTNRLWVLILVFLIRKTISQLLNLIRRERKIACELSILKNNYNAKLLKISTSNDEDMSIFERHEKALKDLKFDKMMLKFELIGDFLDLAFNLVEIYNLPVPGWIMSCLNIASMAMTVYRMNKDTEYTDSDTTQDLI